MKITAALILTMCSIISLFAQASSLTPVGRKTRNDNGLGYYEYLPINYESRDDWPVLIVLHGAGRQGDGSVSSLEDKLGNWGIINWLKSNDVPFVILVPQDPSSNFTGTPTRINSFYGWARVEYSSKTTEYNWSVSYNSFSGGAFDEWSKENTDNFKSVAAHIPSASVISSNTSVEQHENVANSGSSVWFHHSLADNTISYVPTREFFRGIMNVVGSQDHSKYRYTFYQNVGHGTFNSVVYNDKGNTEPQETGDMGGGGFDYYHWNSGSFWDWLLAQDRNPVVDETSPVLSSPVDESSGSISGIGSVDTDEANGTLYWVVSSNNTTPTIEQIKEGKDHSGLTAIINGNIGVTSIGTQNVSFSGLDIESTYYLHFVHTDLSGNNSNVISGDGFITGPEDYNSVIANVSIGVPDFTWTLDGTFNELNGLTTNSSGNIEYSSSIIPGVAGQAWQSNGSSFINPTNSDLINTDPSTEARSISLWFSSTALSGWRNIYEEGGSTHGWHIALYDDYLTFTITQGNAARNSIQYQIEANSVYHVAVVFNLSDQISGANIKMYVNATEIGTTNFITQSFLDAHSGDIKFGERGDGQFLSSDLGDKTKVNFAGQIQRIDYWSEKELTDQDVSDIYFLGGEISVLLPTSITLSGNSLVDGTVGGSLVGSLSSDGSDPLTYSLVTGTGDTDNARFSIVGDELFIGEDVDFSIQESYSIRVEASNSEGSTSDTFIISVTALAPTILSLSSTEISDGTTSGTPIATIDSDGSVPTYAFATGIGDDDNASFSIQNGDELVVNELVNYAVKDTYTIRLSASNGEGSFEDTFTITVSEPTLPPTSITLSGNSLVDGTVGGSLVGSLSSDGSDPLTYSLVTGTGDTDNARFSIVGDELFIGEDVDFSIQESYSIRVEASNSEGSTSDTFIISVTALAPTILSLSSTEISDGTTSGTPIATIDSDGSVPTYAFVTGIGDDDNASFSIQNGDELVVNELVNYAVKDTYTIRLSASNGEGSFEDTFTITVSEPTLPPTSITLSGNSLVDGTVGGSLVGSLSSDGSDPLTYSLVTGTGDTDNARFSIVGDELFIGEDVDFSIQESYSIRVEASNSEGSTSDTFIISVTALAPTILSLSSTEISDGTTSGTPIATIDSDGSVPTYAFATGIGDDDNASFSIQNGDELVVNELVNYAVKDTYTIRLSASNGEGSFEDTFTITVSEPTLPPTSITLSGNSLVDGTVGGSLVGSLSSDGSDPLTYSLVTGTGDTDNARFSIVGDELFIGEDVDFSIQESYSIRVEASNSEGSTSDTFIISVTALAPTILSLSSTEISDGTTSGTPIATIDSDGSVPTYAFVTGIGDDDNASFSIQNGDELVVNELVNYAVKDTYTIRLSASNGEGSFEDTFTITVSEPTLPPTSITLSGNSLVDGTVGGSLVGSLSSDGSDPLTYSLVTGTGDTDNARFSIVGDELFIGEDVDFSIQESYSIRVEASNSEGSTSDTFIISVTALAPTILSLSSTEISDGTTSGTPIATIDSDGSVPTYAFATGIGDDDNASFSIQNGDELVVNELVNYAVKDTYTIRLSASNGEGSFEEEFQLSVLSTNSINLYVTANNANSIYGKKLPALTYGYKGLVNGDNLEEVIIQQPEISTTATSESPVGTYPISISGGQTISKYNLIYEQGELEMLPSELIVRANDEYINQGEDIPEFTLTYDGFVGQDDPSILERSPSASTSANKNSAPGEYSINVANGLSDNYLFTYKSGSLIIGDQCSLVVEILFDEKDSILIAEVSGGTLPYEINWENGQTSKTIEISGSGEYSVEVEDARECLTSSSIIIDTTFVKVLGEEETRSELVIWPNPVSSKLHIQSSFALKNIRVYSMDGKELLNQFLNESLFAVINIGSLKNGAYHVVINERKHNPHKIVILD